MSNPKFWIDFDNGDICRADGSAIASLLAEHCEHEPEELVEFDQILKGHEALVAERGRLRSSLADLLTWSEFPSDHQGQDEYRKVLEACRAALNPTQTETNPC